MFSRKRKRVIFAVYPDGTRHPITKTADGWKYHPRGSCAFPLAVAKAEARDEGAVIETITA